MFFFFKMFNSFYKKPVVNELFFYACLIGGILRTSKVKSKHKILFSALLSSTWIIILPFSIAFLVFPGDNHVDEVIYLAIPFISCGASMLTMAIATYYFKNLDFIFADLDNNSGEHSEFVSNVEKSYIDHLKENIIAIATFIVLTFNSTMKMLIMLSDENSNTQDPFWYIYPFPAFIPVDSPSRGILMMLLQYVVILPNALEPFFALNILKILISQVGNELNGLKLYLRHHSKLTGDAIEAIRQTESEHCIEPIRRDYLKRECAYKLRIVYREFDEKIFYCVRQHRKMNRYNQPATLLLMTYSTNSINLTIQHTGYSNISRRQQQLTAASVCYSYRWE